MKKIVFSVILFLFVFSFHETSAQNNEMFKQKRERKRVWRKHRTSNDAYNPYLKKKAKNKPSARINKGNKKEERRQKRAYKREIKKHRTSSEPRPKS
ncbi:MAG: hypothetical protein H0W73_20425 [Bacteroidetes bacterium]|nr:hypothetical protein [Bacteroidota bacterium]